MDVQTKPHDAPVTLLDHKSRSAYFRVPSSNSNGLCGQKRIFAKTFGAPTPLMASDIPIPSPVVWHKCCTTVVKRPRGTKHVARLKEHLTGGF